MRISPSKGKAGQSTNGGSAGRTPLARGYGGCRLWFVWSDFEFGPGVLTDATIEKYRMNASLETTGINLLTDFNDVTSSLL
jgi:hypothetical protein